MSGRPWGEKPLRKRRKAAMEALARQQAECERDAYREKAQDLAEMLLEVEEKTGLGEIAKLRVEVARLREEAARAETLAALLAHERREHDAEIGRLRAEIARTKAETKARIDRARRALMGRDAA